MIEQIPGQLALDFEPRRRGNVEDMTETAEPDPVPVEIVNPDPVPVEPVEPETDDETDDAERATDDN